AGDDRQPRQRWPQRARANGKTLGRPKIDAGTEASIRKALAKGGQGHTEDRRRVRSGRWNGPAQQGGGGSGGRLGGRRLRPRPSRRGPTRVRRNVDARAARLGHWSRRTATRRSTPHPRDHPGERFRSREGVLLRKKI